MEKNQVEQLKINVTNINSVLVNSNKILKKLDLQKTSAIRKEKERKKVEEREKKIESKPKASGPLQYVGGKIKAAGVGFFDKVLNFAGNVLVGYFLNKLPEIVTAVKGFYSNIEPFLSGAVKALGFLFNGVKFVVGGVSGLFSNKKQLEQDKKDIELLSKELDVEISDLPKESDFISENQETSTNISDSNIIKEDPIKVDTIGDNTMKPSPPLLASTKITPLRRNAGGTITKTTSPIKYRDKREKKSSHGFRKFPKIVQRSIKNTKLFENNVEKFGNLKKLFARSNNIGRGRKPSSSPDNVEITSGPIQPGGRLDFIGSGDGSTGKLCLIDGSGKKIGSWSAISGTYGTSDATQNQRANVSGRLYPLPDGQYPLLGFQKHGFIGGVGNWSTYINNMTGSIGKRSQILVHNDIGSNGTAGCVGVELGGRSGTTAERRFIEAYESVMPTSINVAIGKGSKKNTNLTPRPKVSADNIPVSDSDTEGGTTVIVQPVVIEKPVFVNNVSRSTNRRGRVVNSVRSNSNLNNIP